MCDYCDCRSHPPIAALSAEHEVLLGLLAALRQAADAADRDRAGPALAALRDRLAGHAAREEHGLFHQLRDAELDGEYITMFEQDHRRVDTLLHDAGGRGWRAAVGELVELLTKHIAREEYDLFPVAHQVLAPSQWDAVDAVHSPIRPCEATLASTTGASS
jgi:hemerythrin-like domain-containing protein